MDRQEAYHGEYDFEQVTRREIQASGPAYFRSWTRRQALTLAVNGLGALAASTIIGDSHGFQAQVFDRSDRIQSKDWPQFRLSQEEQDRLAYASYFYTAGRTQAGTMQELMGRVSFIREEDLVKPDILSGPIAIAILDDAELLRSPENIDPVDFKTLRPDKDEKRFDELFPSRSYFKFETSTPAADFDWKAHPLLPGDLLYLRPNAQQDLHQFMAVTRLWYDVPMTVTPVEDAYWGYTIGELKIYDAQDPASGLLNLWLNPEVKKTDPYNGVVGQTGNGGFTLWRARA